MHDIESEQSLIGAVLMKNDLFAQVGDMLAPNDFFELIHGQAWEVISSLIRMGKLANPITIRPFLPADMKIAEGVTLKAYLARLAAAACAASEVPHLAAMVRDLSHRRSIAAIGAQLAETSAPNPTELAEWGVSELDKIASARSQTATLRVTARESMVRTIDGIADAFQRNGAISGISYGLRDLDAKTSGLQRGELTILAGRPGMMKTGIALVMARHMASAGLVVDFYSLEMKDVALSRRLLSDVLYEKQQIPYSRMRSGRVSEAEFTMIRDAADRMADWPLNIEQQDVSVSQIIARSRQRKRKNGLDVVIVDHIGHVQASDRYIGNRNSELAEISGALMRGARELDIGVIALCQLNRGVEGRENKRPHLGDLRESGAIEQDAATVMFVYREAYYLANQEPRPGTPDYELWQQRMEACLNNLEIIIGKQRDGSTGTVQAYVDPACNAVRDFGWTRWDAQQGIEEFAF